MLLADRAWASLPELPLMLVPLGATEQHGPHLPLDTDSVIAAAAASAAAEQYRGAMPEQEVLVAPTLSYGSSGEHQDFPGTVSIGRQALGVVLVELGRSLSLWAGRIVFMNAHGGNAATVAEAVELLLHEGRDVQWVSCGVPGGDAHAGRTETSLMLHLAPHRVDLTAAVPGNPAPISGLLPLLVAGGVRRLSPSGVLGDPEGATGAEGALLFETIVRTVAGQLVVGARQPT